MAFSVWSGLTQSRLADLNVAVLHDTANLRRDAYDQWKQSLNRRRVQATRASVVHQHVLEKRCWGRWKERMLERKSAALMEKKERENVSRVFDCEYFCWIRFSGFRKIELIFLSWCYLPSFIVWRTRSLEKSRDRLLVASFQSRVNRRLQTLALSQWTSVVIERKNTELQVSEEYRNRLVRSALLKWMDGCARHADRLKLMQSFRDIKREGELKKAFSNLKFHLSDFGLRHFVPFF